jgi:hypothetical protein
MKKSIALLLSVLFALTCITSSAQSKVDIGLKGGVNLTFFKITEANFGTNPETATGFYGGLFLDFNNGHDFSIQPEILYIVLNDFNFINAPIYAKYKVGNNFYLSVGPSLNYFFDFFTNKFKIRADIATAYNISSIIAVHLKYTIGFQEITPNGLFVGAELKL